MFLLSLSFASCSPTQAHPRVTTASAFCWKAPIISWDARPRCWMTCKNWLLRKVKKLPMHLQGESNKYLISQQHILNLSSVRFTAWETPLPTKEAQAWVVKIPIPLKQTKRHPACDHNNCDTSTCHCGTHEQFSSFKGTDTWFTVRYKHILHRCNYKP